VDSVQTGLRELKKNREEGKGIDKEKRRKGVKEGVPAGTITVERA